MATTARWGLRYPAGADAPDVPLWMSRLATDLDGVAMDDQGTLAARPVSTVATPGKRGRYFYVIGDPDTTQNNRLYRDYGTGWDEIPVGSSVTAIVGDYKHSAQASDHGSLGGGKFQWLRCDGRAISRATYSGLWDVFRVGGASSPFGNGDGSTTFVLPDPRGRAAVVAGSGAGLTARSLGASGGEERHANSAAEAGVGAHGHGNDIATNGGGEHIHGVPRGVGGPDGAGAYSSTFDQSDRLFTFGGQGAHNHPMTGGVTDHSGASGASHNNMQPFLVIGNLFIRAA